MTGLLCSGIVMSFVGWAKSSDSPCGVGIARPRFCPRGRASQARCPPYKLFLALVVIMDLVEHAAAIGLEWAVMDARRPARIGRRVERLAALALLVIADDEIAGDEINLFPMVVHERRRGVDAGREAQEPRTA